MTTELLERKTKAEAAGYHTDDEFYYSLYLIERLLPYALDPYATPPPTLADELSINRKHAGKAEGYGGWEAGIADIRKAIKATGGIDPVAIQTFLGGANPHAKASNSRESQT